MRQEAGKVRLGFLPVEWFDFFYKKTGVTGPYVFGTGLLTYLFSKEWWVVEHEFYNGLSMIPFFIFIIIKAGPHIGKFVDKEIEKYESELNEVHDYNKKVQYFKVRALATWTYVSFGFQSIQDMVDNETQMQWSNEGQNVIVEAKRENVALQLEAEYRTRLMTVYQAVKRRLDYQVTMTDIENRFVQKNLVDWVVRSVRSSITPDQDKKNIDTCIAELGRLAKA